MNQSVNKPSSDHWVIIPSFNGKDLLPDCIRSIQQASGNWSILVIDNASSDGTNEQIVNDLGAEYIQNTENLGFGAACNQGISYALNEDALTVTIINQDAVVDSQCLIELSDTLNQNPTAGIACPLIYDEKGLLFRRFSNWLVSGNTDFLKDAINKTLKDNYKVPFLNAACWMLSRKALIEVGGFDPIFFMYQEDKELARRFSYYGYELMLNPKAILTHSSSLRAENKTLIERIRWASVAPLSNMLGGMREYERNYWRNLPRVLNNWFNGLTASIFSTNLVSTSGHLIALGKFIMLSGQNKNSYNSIKQHNHSLFLDLNH